MKVFRQGSRLCYQLSIVMVANLLAPQLSACAIYVGRFYRCCSLAKTSHVVGLRAVEKRF